MQNTTDGATFVYIDGMNFENSAKAHQRTTMTADIPGLVAEIVGHNAAAIHYYTGLPTKTANVFRAQKIAFLDTLREKHIQTFANDVQMNAVGKYKEVGIDLKIAADMVAHFLASRRQPITKFVVVSNDTDYRPAFELIRELAKMYNRQIEIVNIVIDKDISKEAKDEPARTILMRPGTFDKYVPSPLEAQERSPYAHDYLKIAATRIARKDPLALDASAHEGKPAGHVPRRTTPLTRGTNYYIDLNSIGATAKREFDRSHLDIDIPKLLDSVNATTERTTKQAKAYVSLHEEQHDPVNRRFVKNLVTELEQAEIPTQTFEYKYRSMPVSNDLQGPGRATPIRSMVANEKLVATKILSDVVLDILKGRTDDIVLVSDDNNLWPIAELAHKIAKATNQVIEVKNVHLGKETISRTNGIAISQDEYLEISGGKRLQAAEYAIDNAVALEAEANRLALLKQFGDTRSVVVDPTNAIGEITGRSKHWFVIDDKKGTIALVPRVPMDVKKGIIYEIHDREITESKQPATPELQQQSKKKPAAQRTSTDLPGNR